MINNDINTGHTATPWIWNDHDQLVSSVVKDHNDELVTIIETDSGFYPPYNDDREFIAHACNAHDGLILALQEIARAGDSHSSALAKAALDDAAAQKNLAAQRKANPCSECKGVEFNECGHCGGTGVEPDDEDGE